MRVTSRRLEAMHPNSNRGAALLLALVFMLLLAIVAATVMRTGALQLRMAGNDQFLEEAFHQAQAVATRLSLDARNFPLDMEAGDVNCPQSSEDPGCDYRLLTVPSDAQLPEGVSLDYRVIRKDPLRWRGFSVRESEGVASSSASFDAAIFDIDVRIDGSGKKLGSAHSVQGIAVRVPASRWHSQVP
jgi:PilX N-terminal